jgi:ribosomal protein S25
MNFVTQIAALVRNMTDTELCKLAVTNLPAELLNGSSKLTIPVIAPPVKAKPGPKPKAKAKTAAPAIAGAKKRGRPAGSKNKPKTDDPAAADAPANDEEDGMMLDIELFVRRSNGVATSEVAEKYNIEKDKAANILKKLVIAGRIFRGGEKRFSRYAKDETTANEASLAARNIAPMAE